MHPNKQSSHQRGRGTCTRLSGGKEPSFLLTVASRSDPVVVTSSTNLPPLAEAVIGYLSCHRSVRHQPVLLLRAKLQEQASQTGTMNSEMAQWLLGWDGRASLTAGVAKGYQSRQWGAFSDMFQESPSIEVICWRLSFRESERGVMHKGMHECTQSAVADGLARSKELVLRSCREVGCRQSATVARPCLTSSVPRYPSMQNFCHAGVFSL